MDPLDRSSCSLSFSTVPPENVFAFLDFTMLARKSWVSPTLFRVLLYKCINPQHNLGTTNSGNGYTPDREAAYVEAILFTDMGYR